MLKINALEVFPSKGQPLSLTLLEGKKYKAELGQTFHSFIFAFSFKVSRCDTGSFQAQPGHARPMLRALRRTPLFQESRVEFLQMLLCFDSDRYIRRPHGTDGCETKSWMIETFSMLGLNPRMTFTCNVSPKIRFAMFNSVNICICLQAPCSEIFDVKTHRAWHIKFCFCTIVFSEGRRTQTKVRRALRHGAVTA